MYFATVDGPTVGTLVEPSEGDTLGVADGASDGLDDGVDVGIIDGVSELY